MLYSIMMASMVYFFYTHLDISHSCLYISLIRWGIVIHGFIDGYSRLIVGLRAHNNNTGAAVLNLFLDGARQYGIPARLRGDHGTENILVAAWMEEFMGILRGSYIWGRPVPIFRICGQYTDLYPGAFIMSASNVFGLILQPKLVPRGLSCLSC